MHIDRHMRAPHRGARVTVKSIVGKKITVGQGGLGIFVFPAGRNFYPVVLL